MDSVLELIYLIFTLWTIKESEYCNIQNQEDQVEKLKFYKQPHPGQILAILRIFGFGQTNESNFRNTLVQIKTGEGKSVILAVVASILALLGFEVSNVCYSEYLSCRDYNSFKLSIFDTLDITQNINYGTFNEISEKLMNEKEDIRKIILSTVCNGNLNSSLKNVKDKPKILLIDEYDVFLAKIFMDKFILQWQN